MTREDPKDKALKRLWNQRTRQLQPYVPGEQPREQLIKLNTNENPFAPPEAVKRLLADLDLQQLRLYPDPSCLQLRQCLASHHELTVDQVFVGNGSDEVLGFAFQAFFEPVASLPVLFPDITYSFYPVYAGFNQLTVKRPALRDDFTLPLALFMQPSAGVILANPNAPTGIALTQSDIEQVVSHDRGRLVIIDEAYVDFGAETVVPLIKRYDNLLVVQTFSKSRALAGIRLGFALGSPGLIQALETIRDSFNSYTVGALTQQIGRLVFEDQAWFETNRARILANRASLTKQLQGYGFNVLPSSANFVFASHPRYSGADWTRLLRQEGILIRHFNVDRIQDHLRITVGTQEQLEALAFALGRLLL